jgi:hypothetical protein
VAAASAKALKITTVTPIERRDHMQEQEPVVHAAEPYLHLRREHTAVATRRVFAPPSATEDWWLTRCHRRGHDDRLLVTHDESNA